LEIDDEAHPSTQIHNKESKKNSYKLTDEKSGKNTPKIKKEI
jgi:hypothetical protein